MNSENFFEREKAKGLLETSFDPCNIFGMPMLANKCKITCYNCGFKRDCSDS